MPCHLRLLLVRHGQVASNRDLRYIGRRDEPLTPEGEEQAEQVGRALAEMPIDRVLASPLERARATAEQIAGHHAGMAVEAERRLIEQAYGEWEGRSRKEIRADASGAEALDRFDADITRSPPGGESLVAVQRRVVDLVEELRGALASAGADLANVVLVTHVGPIKALLAHGVGITLQQTRRLFLDPATLTVIDWGDAPLLRLFNGHCHLGWGNAAWMTRGQRERRS